MMRQEQDEVKLAQDRLAEVVEVYDSVSRSVVELIARIDTGDPTVPKKVASQLALLQELFVKIKKYQEALHDKLGHGLRAGDIDLDAARASIGGRLDRLRDARGAGDISG